MALEVDGPPGVPKIEETFKMLGYFILKKK